VCVFNFEIFEQKKREGWVESKIRILVTQLEKIPFIRVAHPYPDGFDEKVETPEKVRKKKKQKKQKKIAFILFI